MTFVKPLFSRQRRALLRASLLICTGTLLLAPLTMAPSFEAQAGGDPPLPRSEPPALPEPLHFPPIVITHDPFVPAYPPLGGTAENAGGDFAGANAVPIVRAVILGASPKALVDIGGQVEVIGIGGALAGSSVTSIDASGIRLQSGQSLPFSEKQP